MFSRHTCHLLEMWIADPRIPIGFENHTADYILAINAHTKVVLAYCPFCGVDLLRGKDPTPRGESLCKHLLELSRQPNSSLRFRPKLMEYWVFGSDRVSVRLFYCPLCGCKLPQGDNGDRFYEKAITEVSRLTKRFANIKTMDQALKQFGTPDSDLGPAEDYVFPEGRRVRTGYKRALLYDHLAKTATVAVVELPDGRVKLEFHPKERHV